ncbi:MAG: hypothetical protein ACOYXB_15965 [Bacteroidota bacterium]
MADEDNIKAKFQALSYGNEQFDKNVLFIASGALGISFGFIEKVVPKLDIAQNKCLLIDSWYCFAGVIFLSLLAHFISVLANRWAIVNDKMEDSKYNQISRKWNYVIRAANILMIAGLFVGIILLIAFVKQNL